MSEMKYAEVIMVIFSNENSEKLVLDEVSQSKSLQKV